MSFLKKKSNRVYILLFLYYLLFPNKISAQPPYADVADLRVIGNSATFFFKTITQFHDGVTLTDWTTVRFRYKCDADPNWEFFVWTDADSIENIYGGKSISIDNFSIKITAPTTTYTTSNLATLPFKPTTIKNRLVWGTAVTDSIAIVEFKISYTISPDGLDELTSGTYFVPLRIEIRDAP